MITRRMFVAAIAGGCAARECLVLEAVAAETDAASSYCEWGGEGSIF